MYFSLLIALFLASMLSTATLAFQLGAKRAICRGAQFRTSRALLVENNTPNKETGGVDEVVKKSGFEFALFKSLFPDKNDSTPAIKPKDLLAKYGKAYLATSITLALISYAICYALVSAGIDTTALLAKFGISLTSSGQASAGTAAIAYAVHKAASPIRFPPTVALTPLIAKLFGNVDSETPSTGSESSASEDK